MTDDRRFLSHVCLEPKVERDQDGLHLITAPYRNETSLGLVFLPTVRLDSQQPLQFCQYIFSGKKTEEVGKREIQQACCCCVCEKICTTVAAAQFEV